MEFEYAIPLADAAIMLDVLCERPIIEKTRHRETHLERIWEIDVFHGENDGLVIAELEVQNEAEQFQRPTWAKTEVSDDARYFNNNLAKYPYRSWK
jgi:adenylate cyclase